MLKHVVMWKFKEVAEDAAKEENLRKAKSFLDSLPPMIPQIKLFEVGIDMLHSDTSYDLILISGFDDEVSLLTYQKHAEHVTVVKFLRKVQAAKIVVDFYS